MMNPLPIKVQALLVAVAVSVCAPAAHAAPESSARLEALEPEGNKVDSALTQSGVGLLIRARITSTLRANDVRSPCNAANVLCDLGSGNVIVLPGGTVTGDVVNVPNVPPVKGRTSITR